MKESSLGKIDIFTHILPLKYAEALYKKARDCFYIEADKATPILSDLDARFRIMDRYEGLTQVLTLASPPIEHVVNPNDAVELAKIANDEMAELVAKYPHRFVAAVASLPMNNIDAALKEADRAIRELNFKGVQIFSSINRKPLDRPEFMGLYQKMAEYDLPIWIHPTKDRNIPDYPGEKVSKYRLFLHFGWPYETTLAMARLVFSGVLERYPTVKFIIHHGGGMVPYFEQRIGHTPAYDTDIGVKTKYVEKLSRPPIEYFRKFYADTATMGGITPVLMCAYAFFGSDNLLFGSDMPYGVDRGEAGLRQVINSIESMDASPSDKEKILRRNAERILHLAE